jgi:hypothetical protein
MPKSCHFARNSLTRWPWKADCGGTLFPEPLFCIRHIISHCEPKWLNFWDLQRMRAAQDGPTFSGVPFFTATRAFPRQHRSYLQLLVKCSRGEDSMAVDAARSEPLSHRYSLQIGKFTGKSHNFEPISKLNRAITAGSAPLMGRRSSTEAKQNRE